jgi:protein required for attachment to host cells
MPTDARQARIYTDEVMNVLEDARQRVADGKAASFERAVESIAAGDTADNLAVSAPPQALEALRAELRLVIKQEVTAALQEHHGARIAELEERNAYLETELKRRDEVVQHRGWWPWGKRLVP